MRRREARRIGGGAGEQALTSVAGARQFRAFAGAAPALPVRTRQTRAVSGLRPEVQRPPARSWLTGANAEKARPDVVRKTPQQSVERRAGGRIPPAISGDPEIDLAARQITGCGASAPAPVGALLPSFFAGVETDKGAPTP